MLIQVFLLVLTTMSVAFNSQKYVAVDAKSQTRNVENGKTFLILVTIKPVDGIHVNAAPPLSIKPLVEDAMSGNGLTTLGVKAISKKGDYLDLSKPIQVECKVTGINPGLHKINFIVGYTFCSEKEGWCRMGSDTVSVTVKVRK